MATFRALAELCEGLARTRNRLALARQVADFLAGLGSDEVGPAVRLLLGQARRNGVAVSGRTVRPVVVEVLFTDLQRSPTDAAGLALRLARIRDDETSAAADTIPHLRELFARRQAGGGGEA